MKAPLFLVCCLLSASAFAIGPRPEAEDAAETHALADAVLNVDETALRNAIEDEADLADAAGDELARQGQDSSHETAARLRQKAREPKLKENLAKFFRAAGRDLKKTGVTALEFTGYTGDAAAEVILFPLQFTENFVNSTITGFADDGKTKVSHRVAVGVGAGIEAAVIYGLAYATTAAAAGGPAAAKLFNAGLCLIYTLDHEPGLSGEPRTTVTKYCDNLAVIDSRIEAPAIAGGQKAGAWTGQDVRKIGQDVRKIFAKLFRRRAKPAAPAYPSIPAAP